MSNTYEEEITTYSDKVPGDAGNYTWAVRFDNTGPADYIGEPGHIGITQFNEKGQVKERVLLSPDQVEEFLKFARRRRKL